MNLDRLQQFPDQRHDGDPYECCGLTISDILGNYYGQPFDPDFAYSLGFYLPNKTPADMGVDPYAAMCGTIAYGALPANLDTTSALTTSELYVANFHNYTLDQRNIALAWAPNGFKPLHSYDDISDYIQRYKIGAVLILRWHASFSEPYSDGSLPVPLAGEPYSYHCVAVYDKTDKGLQIKPWLSKEYGAGGYGYITRDVFDSVFDSAYGFTPDSWKWLSLVKVCLSFPSRITELLPLLNKPITAPQAPQPPVPAVPAPVAPTEPLKKAYDWSTPEAARHSLRVICDEEGLTVQQKDDMSRTVNCESGYKSIVHPNIVTKHLPDGTTHTYTASTDYGICMWNDFYHGAEISPDTALHNPEAAVRLMCQYVKSGRISQWVCYSEGLYKNYSA